MRTTWICALGIAGWLLAGWGMAASPGTVAHAQTARAPSVAMPAASDTLAEADTAARTDARERRPLSSRALGGRPDDADLFYVAGEKAQLYNRPDSTTPVGTLPVRAPVTRLQCPDFWCKVKTEAGRTGYIAQHALSNVWIRVSKRDRRVYVYRGPTLKHVYKADFGYNAFSDKEQRGNTQERDHWRTPEGVFYVVHRNPNSQFHKALVLNYPTAADAYRGLERGLISRREYKQIVDAQQDFRMPPMNTKLGGWIEIHGDGTGAATNWTQGCVALHNRDMNTLWWWAEVGTPVLVE